MQNIKSSIPYIRKGKYSFNQVVNLKLICLATIISISVILIQACSTTQTKSQRLSNQQILNRWAKSCGAAAGIAQRIANGEYQVGVSLTTELIDSGKLTNGALYDFYYLRGETWEGLKEFDKALNDFSKAIELDPKFISAYLKRSNICEKLGQIDRAISDKEQCLMILSSPPTQKESPKVKDLLKVHCFKPMLESNDKNKKLVSDQLKELRAKQHGN